MYICSSVLDSTRCCYNSIRLVAKIIVYLKYTAYCQDNRVKQAVGGRPPRYAPAPLLPRWAPKRLPPPSRRQRSSSFPRPTCSHAHCCSCLTREHGGEQSGLVTLTFDLLTLKRCPNHVWRGLPLANFGLPRPLCSRLRPDIRDRQKSDVRQKHRLMSPPIRGGP